MRSKSVKSQNPRLALPRRQAGGRQVCKSVIQTSYDIAKSHGGKIAIKSVEENNGLPARQAKTEFTITLRIQS